MTTAPDELNAFITRLDGAQDGIPLGVKDLFDTAGVRTTYGSAIFRDHVPDRTAETVRRLEEAAYAVVGKTNLHEFAYGITSENEHYGDVVNPVAPDRIAGGSSGGSAAALAAGLCDAALGTDTGGSIRIPAACCGIVGFKPTHGLLPMEGVFPLAPSFDHAGPMARTVRECAGLMRALDPTLPTRAVDLADVHVGVAWLEHADPLVRARVDEAAACFGGRRDIVFPLAEEVVRAFMREVADVHHELFAEHRALYGTNVRTKIERCLAVTDREYERACRARERYRAQAADVLADVDLLVVPTLAFVAPPAGTSELDLRGSVTRLTFPLNVLGVPALALPCGPAEDGLPASLSLVGAGADDDLVLDVGAALEQALSPV